MKKLIIPFVIAMLTSCISNYYQVYKAYPENGTMTKDKILFEDKSCIVAYNLWSNGGDVGFNIYNKTENDLTVDLTKSFFIINGVAYDYFQNRTFSKSTSSGAAITSESYPNYYSYYNTTLFTGSNSTSFSTSFNEKPLLTIPSKTQVKVSEFNVSSSRLVHCDLLKRPTKESINMVTFDKSNSPFVFYNLISYKTKSDSVRLENRFYVSEITNFPENTMYTYIDTSLCGRKLEVPERVFTYASPDKFYYRYSSK